MDDRTRMDGWFSAAARVALAGALSALLWGCPGGGATNDAGGNPGSDAGHDAGTDAGHDAGTDAGDEPPELRILTVLPPRSPSGGGVQAEIKGTGFVRGVADRATEAKKFTSIHFGSNPVQDIQIVDDQTLYVRVPPGVAGLTNVTIENPNGRDVCTCFTYYDEIFVRTASPREGPLRGGTEVTITGGGFTSDIQVLFGSQSAPDRFLDSSSQVRVIAPRADAPGLVDITLYSKNGMGVLRRVYRYFEDLRITNLAPLTGPLAGGTEVVISGRGFDGATSVTFGGATAAFTVNSPTQITATAPPASGPGAVDVTIVTPRDQWTARGAFAYVSGAGFEAWGVFPHVGPATGGNNVTVMGEGLGASNVTFTFGGQTATVVSRSANRAVVTVPARGGAPRKVDVVVTSPGQARTLVEGYTYGIALADISPRNGPVTGGTPVELSGSGFPASILINIGALPATKQGSSSETSVRFTTPKGQGGSATDLWARDADDPENEAFLANAFTYEESISIGRVEPDRGAIAGGTLVTVLGSGFGEATLVRFANIVAKDIKVVDSHTLTCRTPKGNVGVVDVKISRLGSEDTLPSGFSYYDPRNISGGLSGGPLTGTLNVTVLDSSPGFRGAPVTQATVMLGTDPFTPFQGLTDHRGQITFSDPSLVKPQTVTVFKVGYESASVTSVNAENLTVYIARTSGDGQPGPPPPAPPPSVISGRVSGFKASRPLLAHESLEARVFLAQESLYFGAPFEAPPDRQGQKWQVLKEGGEYLLFTSSGLHAAYAILGIWNTQTKVFEPHLMGVRRGITVTPDQPATNQDIILDMHLDMTVDVSIDSTLRFDGQPARNNVFAWLDLGAEGLIPNPHNWNSGTDVMTSVSGSQTSLDFAHFPQLDGTNFIFMNLAWDPMVGLPYSIFFRRQPGDLTKGRGQTLNIGPMLPTSIFLEPANGSFSGTIRWTMQSGPTPDIHNVRIVKPTLFGNVILWSMVLPGAETQLTLPPTAVQKLREEEAGNGLFVDMFSSRSPKFSYNQWNYDTLSTVSWSSFTYTRSDPFVLF